MDLQPNSPAPTPNDSRKDDDPSSCSWTPYKKISQTFEIEWYGHSAEGDVRLWSFSPYYNNKRLKAKVEDPHSSWAIEVQLSQGGIHVYRLCIDDGERFVCIPQIQTVLYRHEQYNFVVIDYKYPIEIVQMLYEILGKVEDKRDCVEDLRKFITENESFDINTKFNNGYGGFGNFLHFAVYNGCTKIVQFLLEKGIDQQLKFQHYLAGFKYDRKTALEIAQILKMAPILAEFQKFSNQQTNCT
eukprot:TRINITY_DN12686_c0_g1_i1.p1 TRINITY_DN12686_c0_g1~~TRINITY_DN12686_c0_g1_i1.p1  ORF type:complete len:243 (+),score=45.00 TRINITY_DN12686_c0_g1_i1:34-762(+)